MQKFGGRISWRTGLDGEMRAYEVNIALFDALKGTVKGEDQLGEDRFICAHAIMLALEGIPAFYIHSLLATGNDYEKLRNTQHNRAINRHCWQLQEVDKALNNFASPHARVYKRLKELISIRRRQDAFHPNATQFTLHLGNELFGFWRQSMDRRQSIFCISNIADEAAVMSYSDINLISDEPWYDLVTSKELRLSEGALTLAPYQTCWISNNRPQLLLD